MKKIITLMLAIFIGSANAFAFSELGVSHKNCVRAEQDALNMADGHCVGIDTQGVTQARFGQCTEQTLQNHKTYKVHIYYTCKMPDYDRGYDNDFASN